MLAFIYRGRVDICRRYNADGVEAGVDGTIAMDDLHRVHESGPAADVSPTYVDLWIAEANPLGITWNLHVTSRRAQSCRRVSSYRREDISGGGHGKMHGIHTIIWGTLTTTRKPAGGLHHPLIGRIYETISTMCRGTAGKNPGKVTYEREGCIG